MHSSWPKIYTYIGSAWRNHNHFSRHRALVRIKIYIIQASKYVCNRPITKYNYTILIIFYICATSTYTTILIYIHAIIHTKYIICWNFMQQTGKTCVIMQKFTSCMFHNKLLLVCPLHEHLTCHRLGCPAAVGFHTDLQLYCRMHKRIYIGVYL